MRKLASIQRIKVLDPIPGADAIERATVLGWQLVVKKGEFKVGELCVYCEVDCLMPDDPRFEFLKPRGMRIRTVRLRGQISQGICFPLSFLPVGFDVREDAECTTELGITKYEPPIPACLNGVAKGPMPSFIPKTIENKLRAIGANIAIQGEVVGEGVQGNLLKLRGQSVRFFNAFDIDQREYFSFDKFTEIMRGLALETVPVIAVDYKLENDINAIVKMATRKSLVCPDAWAEGIVIRPLIERRDPEIGRLSFKAINPEFLLKTGQ